MKTVNNFRLLAIVFLILILCSYMIQWLYYQVSFSFIIMFILGTVIFVSSPCMVYSVRMVLTTAFYSFISKPDPSCFFKESVFSGVVLLSDLDVFLHMNNARYKRELDFARALFFIECGVYQSCMQRNRQWPLMVASTGRYRKSLTLFQTYKIITKMVYWDEEKLYFEQRYVSKYKENKQFVYQINLIAIKTIKETPEQLLLHLFPSVPKRPSITNELENFIEYNKASSTLLKREIKLD